MMGNKWEMENGKGKMENGKWKMGTHLPFNSLPLLQIRKQ